eukprot:218429_1
MTHLVGHVSSAVGKLVGGVKDMIGDFNQGTLSGAIDIIVVKREATEDTPETFTSTAFHVKFGKLQLLRSFDRAVWITLNDQPVDLQMKLSRRGYAYFLIPHSGMTNWDSDASESSGYSPSPVKERRRPDIRDEEKIPALVLSPDGPELLENSLTRSKSDTSIIPIGSDFESIPNKTDTMNSEPTIKREPIPLDMAALRGVAQRRLEFRGRSLSPVARKRIPMDQRSYSSDVTGVITPEMDITWWSWSWGRVPRQFPTATQLRQPHTEAQSSPGKHNYSLSMDSGVPIKPEAGSSWAISNFFGYFRGSKTGEQLNIDPSQLPPLESVDQGGRPGDIDELNEPSTDVVAVVEGDQPEKLDDVSLGDEQTTTVEIETTQTETETLSPVPTETTPEILSESADIDQSQSRSQPQSTPTDMSSRPQSPIDSGPPLTGDRTDSVDGSIPVEVSTSTVSDNLVTGTADIADVVIGLEDEAIPAVDELQEASDDVKDYPTTVEPSIPATLESQGGDSLPSPTKEVDSSPEKISTTSLSVAIAKVSEESTQGSQESPTPSPDVISTPLKSPILSLPSTSPPRDMETVSGSPSASPTEDLDDTPPASSPLGPGVLEEIDINSCISPMISDEPPTVGEIQISLCGDFLRKLENSSIELEYFRTIFYENLVSWCQLCRQPSLLGDVNLIVLWRGRVFPGNVMVPLLFSFMAFGKPLDNSAFQKLALSSPYGELNIVNPLGNSERKPSNWRQYLPFSRWSGSSKPEQPSSATVTDFEPFTPLTSELEEIGADNRDKDGFQIPRSPPPPGPLLSDMISPSSSAQKSPLTTPVTETLKREDHLSSLRTQIIAAKSPHSEPRPSPLRMRLHQRSDSEGTIEDEIISVPAKMGYRRSLRPSSDVLKSLNLKPGRNTIKFSVTSTLQGPQSVEAFIYLWPADSKIVISDIDGTITRSDVLGNVLPFVGAKWAHSGVASLFSRVQANGYKVMYLTSRAIGQADITRKYIFDLQQTSPSGDEEHSLPDGPIIMAPDGLVRAFRREVIERRAQDFKIPALRDVKNIFGPDYNPFYAGFGNRIADVHAYTNVEVPEKRIFTISPSGEIESYNQGLTQSYTSLRMSCDAMFPPVDGKDAINPKFGMLFWKDEIIDIDQLEAMDASDDDDESVLGSLTDLDEDEVDERPDEDAPVQSLTEDSTEMPDKDDTEETMTGDISPESV